MPVGILDALVDTEEWLNWTKHFRPISGHDSKLEDPRDRYIVTAFCYGFRLRSTDGADPSPAGGLGRSWPL